MNLGKYNTGASFQRSSGVFAFYNKFGTYHLNIENFLRFMIKYANYNYYITTKNIAEYFPREIEFALNGTLVVLSKAQ